MNLLRATLPKPLGTVVQPIVDASTGVPRLYAIECLTRGPRGTRLEQAPPLFDYIRSRGLETPMDRACIAEALRNAAGYPCRISVNAHPSTLQDGFAAFLLDQSQRWSIDPARLIVEIGEQSPCSDMQSFGRTLISLRQHGVAIAIDDVGFGHSNYKAILDSRPEFLKIDRYFINGVADDPARMVVVESILRLADHFGAQVIAEGVEREQDHTALRGAGLTLFQGFLFGRPLQVSRDRAQHPFVDGVLQYDQPIQQPFVQPGVDFADERNEPVRRGQHRQQRAVNWLGFRPFERVVRETATEQVRVDRP